MARQHLRNAGGARAVGPKAGLGPAEGRRRRREAELLAVAAVGGFGLSPAVVVDGRAVQQRLGVEGAEIEELCHSCSCRLLSLSPHLI